VSATNRGLDEDSSSVFTRSLVKRLKTSILRRSNVLLRVLVTHFCFLYIGYIQTMQF
jgi:hypothetical protein